jgi:tripartite-type tricarboxylate transporter receptor subunit TctC
MEETVKSLRPIWYGLMTGAALAASLPLVASAAYPERPVTIIVAATAGGGTDATARLLAKQLQDELKQPFNVVNQNQAAGLVGHTNINTARPDGYTLGIVYNYFQWNLTGQTKLDHKSWTPIALYNIDPAAFLVSSDSKIKTMQEALTAIKADPGKAKISCGGSCGGSWHIPLAGLFIKTGIDPKLPVMVSAGGAASGLQELVSGGVDYIAASLPEAAALMSAGKVKPLVVFSTERQAAYKDVPTTKEAANIDHAGGAFRSVAGPPGLPADIVSTLEKTLEKIWKSAEFKTAMESRGFGMKWLGSKDTGAFWQQHEKDLTETMTALGLVKR